MALFDILPPVLPAEAMDTEALLRWQDMLARNGSGCFTTANQSAMNELELALNLREEERLEAAYGRFENLTARPGFTLIHYSGVSVRWFQVNKKLFERRLYQEAVTPDDSWETYWRLGRLLEDLVDLSLPESVKGILGEMVVQGLSLRDQTLYSQSPLSPMYPSTVRERNSPEGENNHNVYFLETAPDNRVLRKTEPLKISLGKVSRRPAPHVGVVQVEPLLWYASQDTGYTPSKDWDVNTGRHQHAARLMINESAGHKLKDDQAQYLAMAGVLLTPEFFYRYHEELAQQRGNGQIN